MQPPPYGLDLYYQNTIPSFAAAQKAGLAWVIHKVSQGLTFKDPLYQARMKECMGLGLLWGGYHFGEKGNGAGQADYYLSLAGNVPGTLHCLDLEPSQNSHGDMALADAEAYILRIYERTGRYPVVYTANYYIDAINGHHSEILARCPLWVATYGNVPVIPTPWTGYTFWQFTDGVYGDVPHSLPGLGHNDLNVSIYPLDKLKAWWMGNPDPPVNPGDPHVPDKTMQVNTPTLNVRRGSDPQATSPLAMPVPYQLHQGDKVQVDPSTATPMIDGHQWVLVKHWVALDYLSAYPPS